MTTPISEVRKETQRKTADDLGRRFRFGPVQPPSFLVVRHSCELVDPPLRVDVDVHIAFNNLEALAYFLHREKNAYDEFTRALAIDELLLQASELANTEKFTDYVANTLRVDIPKVYAPTVSFTKTAPYARSVGTRSLFQQVHADAFVISDAFMYIFAENNRERFEQVLTVDASSGHFYHKHDGHTYRTVVRCPVIIFFDKNMQTSLKRAVAVSLKNTLLIEATTIQREVVGVMNVRYPAPKGSIQDYTTEEIVVINQFPGLLRVGYEKQLNDLMNRFHKRPVFALLNLSTTKDIELTGFDVKQPAQSLHRWHDFDRTRPFAWTHEGWLKNFDVVNNKGLAAKIKAEPPTTSTFQELAGKVFILDLSGMWSVTINDVIFYFDNYETVMHFLDPATQPLYKTQMNGVAFPVNVTLNNFNQLAMNTGMQLIHHAMKWAAGPVAPPVVVDDINMQVQAFSPGPAVRQEFSPVLTEPLITKERSVYKVASIERLASIIRSINEKFDKSIPVDGKDQPSLLRAVLIHNDEIDSPVINATRLFCELMSSDDVYPSGLLDILYNVYEKRRVTMTGTSLTPVNRINMYEPPAITPDDLVRRGIFTAYKKDQFVQLMHSVEQTGIFSVKQEQQILWELVIRDDPDFAGSVKIRGLERTDMFFSSRITEAYISGMAYEKSHYNMQSDTPEANIASPSVPTPGYGIYDTSITDSPRFSMRVAPLMLQARENCTLGSFLHLRQVIMNMNIIDEHIVRSLKTVGGLSLYFLMYDTVITNPVIDVLRRICVFCQNTQGSVPFVIYMLLANYYQIEHDNNIQGTTGYWLYNTNYLGGVTTKTMNNLVAENLVDPDFAVLLEELYVLDGSMNMGMGRLSQFVNTHLIVRHKRYKNIATQTLQKTILRDEVAMNYALNNFEIIRSYQKLFILLIPTQAKSTEALLAHTVIERIEKKTWEKLLSQSLLKMQRRQEIENTVVSPPAQERSMQVFLGGNVPSSPAVAITSSAANAYVSGEAPAADIDTLFDWDLYGAAATTEEEVPVETYQYPEISQRDLLIRRIMHLPEQAQTHAHILSFGGDDAALLNYLIQEDKTVVIPEEGISLQERAERYTQIIYDEYKRELEMPVEQAVMVPLMSQFTEADMQTSQAEFLDFTITEQPIRESPSPPITPGPARDIEVVSFGMPGPPDLDETQPVLNRLVATIYRYQEAIAFFRDHANEPIITDVLETDAWVKYISTITPDYPTYLDALIQAPEWQTEEKYAFLLDVTYYKRRNYDVIESYLIRQIEQVQRFDVFENIMQALRRWYFYAHDRMAVWSREEIMIMPIDRVVWYIRALAEPYETSVRFLVNNFYKYTSVLETLRRVFMALQPKLRSAILDKIRDDLIRKLMLDVEDREVMDIAMRGIEKAYDKTLASYKSNKRKADAISAFPMSQNEFEVIPLEHQKSAGIAAGIMYTSAGATVFLVRVDTEYDARIQIEASTPEAIRRLRARMPDIVIVSSTMIPVKRIPGQLRTRTLGGIDGKAMLESVVAGLQGLIYFRRQKCSLRVVYDSKRTMAKVRMMDLQPLFDHWRIDAQSMLWLTNASTSPTISDIHFTSKAHPLRYFLADGHLVCAHDGDSVRTRYNDVFALPEEICFIHEKFVNVNMARARRTIADKKTAYTYKETAYQQSL